MDEKEQQTQSDNVCLDSSNKIIITEPGLYYPIYDRKALVNEKFFYVTLEKNDEIENNDDGLKEQNNKYSLNNTKMEREDVYYCTWKMNNKYKWQTKMDISRDLMIFLRSELIEKQMVIVK